MNEYKFKVYFKLQKLNNRTKIVDVICGFTQQELDESELSHEEMIVHEGLKYVLEFEGIDLNTSIRYLMHEKL
ncbi:hypothetical protein [Schinkia azotoformans]|uniref:hypothetical protein n=1 Tax=Schinkia azotoformans TaxID=1454 RepID=UPI002DB9C751|nr:hypothetical protein [Schinkia azotoformans]MEC1772844.1 hypothetical protein [Schinkia azotoformans]MED4367437.1 hypothetical protein [Schinkia azotoformans]